MSLICSMACVTRYLSFSLTLELSTGQPMPNDVIRLPETAKEDREQGLWDKAKMMLAMVTTGAPCSWEQVEPFQR